MAASWFQQPKRVRLPRAKKVEVRAEGGTSFLLRLMQFRRLNPKVRLGPEDAMCVEFAASLRAASIEGRLRGVWTHPAQELAHGHRSGVGGAIAKAMGMITGTSDYLLLWDNGAGVLEAKSATGSLTEAQKDWRKWCEAQGVRHAVFRTVDQGEDKLREWGVLS